MSTILGFEVIVVAVGTVIIDDETDESKEVTDSIAILKGNTIYCTKPIYEYLKQGFVGRDN